MARLILFALLLTGCIGVLCQKNRTPDCTCTDVDPRFGRDKHLKFVRARCWEHLKEGECDRGFMFNTVEELSEGFCQITCGRCNCCRTMRNVAQDAGLTDWIWAKDAAGVKEIDQPGWEVSVLAPGNGAVEDLLNRLGWTRAEVEEDVEKREVLRDVLLFNIISPLPDHWAVYTSPFFTEGVQLKTEFEATGLTVREWGGGSIGFQGPGNSATVQRDDFDKASCKGFLHIADQFVLPLGIDRRLSQNASNRAAAEDASARDRTRQETRSDVCQIVRETEFDGELIETMKADHSEHCCALCIERSSKPTVVPSNANWVFLQDAMFGHSVHGSPVVTKREIPPSGGVTVSSSLMLKLHKVAIQSQFQTAAQFLIILAMSLKRPQFNQLDNPVKL